ncbi:MAG: DUF4331 domain-containing protein [Candidatus Binatia bacterium]
MSIPNRSHFAATALAVALAAPGPGALASSHMDAPLITLDDAANTTDVYAFVSERDSQKYLTTAVSVYPFEEPGIGPNKYNFDDAVRYELHVLVGDDLAAGRATLTYRFEFETTYRNPGTILQSYLGVIGRDQGGNVDYANQNLVQTYTVTRVDHRGDDPEETPLGQGTVPPNNQGIATPLYNQGDDGGAPAREGVDDENDLDDYTRDAVAELGGGFTAFAGQRDDGFYADVQAIFDLLQLRSGEESFDSQAGFNVHTIALNIPMDELGGDQQVVGVYASTSRRRVSVLRRVTPGSGPGRPEAPDTRAGQFVQVARQGNPLFNEGLVAIADKDLYSRTKPHRDGKLFRKYAEKPELAALINAIVFGGQKVAVEDNRTDIAGIFIPDVIRVDLSTAAARGPGNGEDAPAAASDPGYSRMSIFGGDTLQSTVQAGLFGNGTVAGGWPNGRRFGDDVVDIAVSALVSDLRDTGNLVINPADGIDNVSSNDIGYNKVFPYAPTPLNGRNHRHH